jgi:hypothetical protein
MKTSNYITLSFFVFLFGGIFVLFLAAKIDPRGSYHHGKSTQEKVLDDFLVVVAESGANIRLSSGESSKMVLNYSKEDSCSFPAFRVKDDTLFVGSNPPRNKYYRTEILCKQINSIEGKAKSQINVEEFRCDSLLVRLNKTDFRYLGVKNSVGFSLKLIAIDSYINVGSATFSNLDMSLNHTQMDGWGNRIHNLSGKLNEKSRVSMDKIGKISLESDSTSSYRLEK